MNDFYNENNNQPVPDNVDNGYASQPVLGNESEAVPQEKENQVKSAFNEAKPLFPVEQPTLNQAPVPPSVENAEHIEPIKYQQPAPVKPCEECNAVKYKCNPDFSEANIPVEENQSSQNTQPNPFVKGNSPQNEEQEKIYNTPPTAPPFNYYPPAPPKKKEKMSSGYKALVIIVIAVLVTFFLCFSMYLAFLDDYHAGNQVGGFETEATSGFGFDDDYGFGGGFTFETESPTQDQQSYPQSNAKDEIDKDYSGVQLKSKPKNTSDEKYGASYSYNALNDTVVGVVCYYEEDEDTDTYQTQGTGIIVTSDGYIVTNSHVIGNSRTAYLIKVITADKKEYKAGVVGYDSRSDIAVLKINGNNLPCAEFGDSTQVKVTEDVIAIGNPNGLTFQNSVTKGIVSALNRKVSSSNNVEFLQIDAAINPGNSGGPLCNMYGQVIGITISKIASEYYEGMGFAIPSVTMKTIVDDIIKNGYVTNRVKIGITGTVVYESSAGANGIQIAAITQGGPMDVDGVQVKDIITAVDGEEVTTFAEIYDILEQHSEGEKVTVTLYRPSYDKTFEVNITLQVDKAED